MKLNITGEIQYLGSPLDWKNIRRRWKKDLQSDDRWSKGGKDKNCETAGTQAHPVAQIVKHVKLFTEVQVDDIYSASLI